MQEKGIHPMQLKAKIAERNWIESINVEEVLRSANLRKHWEQEAIRDREERKRKEAEALAAKIEKCNANYFYNLIRKFFITNYGEFIYDNRNEGYVRALCFFLSGDPRFETELDFSFKKGLLIIGDAGLGKTRTIEAVRYNEIRPISIFSMIDITERVREIGSVEINTSNHLLLDDVGSEQETVNHYGTKINWFKDFIESYYLHNKVYNKLLITTNCGGAEIEKKYGYRVRSRIREMFNVIEVTGSDLRK